MLTPKGCSTALALVLALGGCEKPRVAWEDPRTIAAPRGDDRLAISPSGQPSFVGDVSSATVAPAAPGLCPTSVRLVRGAGQLFAAWWSVRRDSSAVLYTAASRDSGKTWGKPTPVDTSDVSSDGCRRPPPALATVGDDLHTAYSMIAPEGTGVFFAHFMGSMLHSPVAVVYGERLVATSIAVRGDSVAVAYEDPNGPRQQVDVALSLTQGHIFEWHETASRDVDAAADPLVALAGPWLGVSWRVRRPTGAPDGNDTSGARVVRMGRLQ